MMTVIEQQSVAKSTTTPSEDAVVVTSSYAGVIDGATPKTSFLYPTGETPGQMAARLIAEAIPQLPADASALEVTQMLTHVLHQDDVLPCNRPMASCVIYSVTRREVWLLGDCHFATITDTGQLTRHSNEKRIDHLLSDWRRAIVTSYLSRGLMTQDEIIANDPGRRIIQPHITRQVRFQNMTQPHPLAYCMLDGEPVQEEYIRIYPIAGNVSELILASDGYPTILSSLSATEDHLQRLLKEDPLCIGPLLGTKGIRPGNQSFDDRTYLRIKIV